MPEPTDPVPPPSGDVDEAPAIAEVLASVGRLSEAWAGLRLDTPEDQALHDRLVDTSRRTIAAFLRANPSVLSEPNGYRGGAGTGSPLLSRLRVIANGVSVVADEMEEERGDSVASTVGGWSMRLRDIERAAREYDRTPSSPPAGDTTTETATEYRVTVMVSDGNPVKFNAEALQAKFWRENQGEDGIANAVVESRTVTTSRSESPWEVEQA